MKRVLLAVVVLLPFALARTRAQETAYVSLVGMADSAATDRGPQAGEIPQGDRAGIEGHAATEPRTEPETAPAAPIVAKTAYASSYAPAPKRAKREAEKEGEAPMVAAPAPSAPRIWTSFFSSLLPAASSVPSFEVAVSTAPRALPRAPRPATTASAAGAAQGFRELFAASTAPLSPER
jgi:hypothetical protein